eukprot:4147500-Alexandrium_andersonii.AAC.1
MARTQLLRFRAEVLAALKNLRAACLGGEAGPPATKKVRLSSVVDGTAEAEVELLSPDKVNA